MKKLRASDFRRPSRRGVGVLLILSVGVTAALVAGRTAAAVAGQNANLKPDAPAVSYFKDIRPIVREHCAGCHQPAVKQGELTLTTHERIMDGGAKGRVFMPGQPEQRLLIATLTVTKLLQMHS